MLGIGDIKVNSHGLHPKGFIDVLLITKQQNGYTNGYIYGKIPCGRSHCASRMRVQGREWYKVNSHFYCCFQGDLESPGDPRGVIFDCLKCQCFILEFTFPRKPQWKPLTHRGLFMWTISVCAFYSHNIYPDFFSQLQIRLPIWNII